MTFRAANHPAPGKAGIGSLLAIGHHWPGLPEPGLLAAACASHMNLLHVVSYEVAFYWPWWLCFAAIAFCLARWLGGLGLLPSALVISALIS